MKKFIYTLLISCAIFSCKQQKESSKEIFSEQKKEIHNTDKIKELDSLIHGLITSKKTLGVSYAIQFQNDSLVTKNYGFTSVDSDKKIANTSQFRIASITKSFTATAIIQLMEKGKLNFEDKLDTFFPNFPNGDKITIYHLLSHTSGLSNWYEFKMPDNVPAIFPLCPKPQQYLKEIHKTTLFEPGKLYSYSNSGYVLLGELIEQLSGMSYETYLDTYIFNPSGMLHTELERNPKDLKEGVEGYAYNEDADPPFVSPISYPMPFSAGALRSTTLDLLKFLKSFNSNKLINEENRLKMTKYAINTDGVEIDESIFYYPKDFKKQKQPKGLERFGYGLGFSCMKMFGTETVSHSGFIAGFRSLMLYVPKSGVSFSILLNTELHEDEMDTWMQIQKKIIELE